MRYVFDHDYHIHSALSLCSRDPEQSPERILKYARDNRLKTICLTDHFWDERVSGPSDWYARQDFAHISAARPLPQAEGIRFLFGCETEMDRHMRLAISRERFDEFDFVVIPTTHFHMEGLTRPAEISSPKQKAEFWMARLNALLDMDLPFHKNGVAHLTCSLIDRNREAWREILRLLDEDALRRVMARAAERGVGIELNADDMRFFTEEEADLALRPYRAAKAAGCKFYCGSDAHHPDALENAPGAFERAIERLELTEDDKFHIGA